MLATFCVRLAVGLLAGLLLLSPKQLHPRFFRTHFLTVLGLLVVATIAGEAYHALLDCYDAVVHAVEFVLRERGLPSLTDRTIVERAALEAELERIRSRGYAIDDEESARGLRCVAAPVRDGRGEVVCALSLSSPAERLSLEEAEEASAAVIETADEISRRLGWGGERAAGGRRRRKEVV